MASDKCAKTFYRQKGSKSVSHMPSLIFRHTWITSPRQLQEQMAQVTQTPFFPHKEYSTIYEKKKVRYRKDPCRLDKMVKLWRCIDTLVSLSTDIAIDSYFQYHHEILISRWFLLQISHFRELCYSPFKLILQFERGIYLST